MTLLSDMSSSYNSLDDIILTLGGSNVLNSAVQVALGNGHHRFAALKEFSAGNEHMSIFSGRPLA